MSTIELPLNQPSPTPPPQKTEVGNYFISNYPPFSAWKADRLAEITAALDAPPPKADTPLGLYLHIPFCRKRCKFCYFRVYTDKNASDVETYLQALSDEVGMLSQKPFLGGRPLRFVYFGGGTPSFLSTQQLTRLVERLDKHISWRNAEEVTFECEPGTLQRHKLEALRAVGVTRLSLGIENFNDAILEENGRAHLSAEVFKAYGWAREIGFPQINIDLIAGMVGETWENWRDCIAKTLELAPDSVTIYQMELPFNTVYSKGVLKEGKPIPVADWPTKRAWMEYAWDTMQAAGYTVGSGYTLVRDKSRTQFAYRDNLWRGSDMMGTGVASFGHVSGVHYQNLDTFDTYVDACKAGRLPLSRAYTPTDRQRLIREMILQMKLGRLEGGYFRTKFGVDVFAEFAPAWDKLAGEGMLSLGEGRMELSRAGLLQVDKLLPEFFEPEFRGGRYT
jgi:oxygen-independent coproporphyrinogen-3 oxidase